MRLLTGLVGLSLPALSAGLVGGNDWVELTYEGGDCWVLDLPGVDGERELYAVLWDLPLSGEPWAYADCRVSVYDEDAGTLTLSCPGAEDFELDFEWLAEWLAGGEESREDAVVQEKGPELECTTNWCQCDGKCSVCCSEGFVASCHCAGNGVCKCVAVDLLAADDFVY